MNSRGTTLIELLVVCGMFLVVSAVLITIYSSMIRIDKHVSLKTDLDRVLLAAVRHLDSDLKSSRVLEPLRPDAWTTPVEVTRLKLQPLEVSPDGTPEVSAEGFPVWGPSYDIVYENGELSRRNPAVRILAKLETDDTLTFLRTEKNLLQMRIAARKSGERGAETSRDTTFAFRLFNQ